MSGRVSALGAQARTTTTTLRARLSKDSRAALSRRAGRIRLFPAVTLALLAGLGVAFIAYGFLRWITPVDTAKAAAEIDVTRVALTVVAGVGGVVALVIAYRRQRDLEQSRFVERFGAAATQLGATDVAVRIAGVYAMAGVADESDGLRRQQCIDVLCGYLRLPYSPELGANHQSKLVLKQHRATADGTRADDQERHLEYRHNDREVRATIVRVIADHLRTTAEYSWSTSDFDLRTAHLENVDFTGARFLGSARFNSATFSGTTRFSYATFSDDPSFNDVTFSEGTWFNDATFSATASFNNATFSATTSFNNVTFPDVTRFSHATFSDEAWFSKVAFSATAWFNGTTFSDNAVFSDVTFSATTVFDGATFSGDAMFNSTTFSATARFRGATFSATAMFDGTTFSGYARFDDVTFSAARFNSATFSATAMFNSTTFSGDARFEKVDFGSGTVSFVNPRQWGPPAPIFDWDPDLSQKPANVEPQDWPPALVPAT
ncbi:pentapeptide repeat-containing protein [Nocardia pseudovaccinii]|uniref:pentapeptide repeat-containing protein n=1 Tax=Nocardia pseudovaccinii TaxID=189540 RepID=UPI003D8D555D